VVVWLKNSLIVLLFMTETSDALSKQTKEILGETVVLGEGFEDAEAEAQAYFLSKRTGNQDDESFFDRVKNFFKPKVEEEPPLETIQVPELKVTPAKPVEDDTKMMVSPKVTPKDTQTVDDNWYQSEATINILKDATYSNLYAKGKVGQEMGYQLPLGYRTNNWLSIHQLGIPWDGLSEVKEDKKVLPNFKKETHSVMEVFNTPEFGVRAAMVDVMTKALKTGSPEMTLKKLIDSGYMENATNYVNVGKGLGINLNTKFNLFNKEEAMKWFDYMLLSEMGRFKDDIPKAERDKVFNSAYDMAMDRMKDKNYTYYDTAMKYLNSSQ
tara:strand:+ start:293 stop:1267 length:975 start_codon:yes stop_codon:yes gene_type:complete